MGFGESVFSAGFIQKTVKEDLFIKANQVYSQRYLLGNTLEGTRSQPTEEDHEGMTCGAGRPNLQADRPIDPIVQSPLQMLVLYRLLDSIYVVLLCQFDLRV